MKPFSAEYFILVVISAIGVFQLAALHGGLRGMLIFQSPGITKILGMAFPLTAAFWFFGTKDRKLSDHLGGLSSNEIALAFFLGVVTAWVLTITISSLVNHNRWNKPAEPGDGLDSLAKTTYFRALLDNLRNR